MEKHLTNTDKQQTSVVQSKPNLINALAKGDRQTVNIALREFKTPQGVICYDKVLAIPRDQRLPELAKNDFNTILTIITAALTLAFEGLNLKRAMTPGQIVDLAEMIIESSHEDNLAMEDLMLFLQKFVRGEYGAMYESMDIPKFMLCFEDYRETRWQELNNIRLNLAAQHKVQGDMGRSNQPDELSIHFSNMADKLSSMNSALKETRKENQKLKDIDKF